MTITWILFNLEAEVNIDKTKIVIFGSGHTPQNLSFKYNGSEIEVVKNFNYFGIIFSKTGNFNLAKKRLVDKAVVSMYAAYMPTLLIYAVVYRIFKSSTAYRF